MQLFPFLRWVSFGFLSDQKMKLCPLGKVFTACLHYFRSVFPFLRWASFGFLSDQKMKLCPLGKVLRRLTFLGPSLVISPPASPKIRSLSLIRPSGPRSNLVAITFQIVGFWASGRRHKTVETRKAIVSHSCLKSFCWNLGIFCWKLKRVCWKSISFNSYCW